MACIKDEELFKVLDEHAEQLRSSSFQVNSTSAVASCPLRRQLQRLCSHLQPCLATLSDISKSFPKSVRVSDIMSIADALRPLQDKEASVAMRRSIQGMLEELEPNLWEHVLCRLVDYGHTFSPEIEMAALTHGDELLHGEAVNIDMALTTQVGTRQSLHCAAGLSAASSRSHLTTLSLSVPGLCCGPQGGVKLFSSRRDCLTYILLTCVMPRPVTHTAWEARKGGRLFR